MKKYVKALKKCLEELEKERVKIGEDVGHAHIYEENKSILDRREKNLGELGKIGRRNVLFGVKEENNFS